MKHKKQILYLRTDLHKNPLIAGGSVSHTVGVVNGLCNVGCEVLYSRSVVMPAVEKNMSSCIPLTIPSWLWKAGIKGASLASNFLFYRQLKKAVQKHAFSYIYQRYSLLNCVGVWLSKYRKVPLILEYNGSEVWADKHWGSPGWRKYVRMSWVIDAIERYNLNHAHRVVVVSQTLQKSLVAQGIAQEKIVVVPNGVDVELFDATLASGARTTIRKALGIEHRFVFGFVGTFGPWHGIEMLASMIPALIAQKPTAHFIIIGDGPGKRAFEHKLQAAQVMGHVTMVGTVPPDQSRDYLSACDAFVCPTQPNPDGSEFFGSPTKLFEYMALGKPIIASDIAQLSQILHPALSVQEVGKAIDDHMAIMVAPTSLEGFVTAACRLMELDSIQQGRLGENARNQVKNYSWNNHVAKILDTVNGRV